MTRAAVTNCVTTVTNSHRRNKPAFFSLSLSLTPNETVFIYLEEITQRIQPDSDTTC